jgi:putative SOS response-associated peptidase YedK
MINARAETVATNRSFQPSFENHRCLVVADGFFEWKKEGAVKKPYYVHLRNGDPMGLAGLYNNWISPEGKEICTCTIVTTDANDALVDIHERMPFIAPAEQYGLWLDPAVHDKETLLPFLKPFPSDELLQIQRPVEHHPPDNSSIPGEAETTAAIGQVLNSL